MSEGKVALIGLGAIGVPLAKLLNDSLGERFIVLADGAHASRLRGESIRVNGDAFEPRIEWDAFALGCRLNFLFFCVKNYSLAAACDCVEDMVDEGTVLVPLQNGVYARDYVSKRFPANIVLDAFVQGPNTRRSPDGFVYENPGAYHIGSMNSLWRSRAKEAHSILVAAGVDCVLDDDIRHAVWKKLMLNVAGNALTALTGMDYSMFRKSWPACEVCRKAMGEFMKVARAKGVDLAPSDVGDVMEYYLGYEGSKRTSMLEDVFNCRQTENEYIAGHVRTMASETGIETPTIDMLYSLMKIKEDVYLGRLG